MAQLKQKLQIIAVPTINRTWLLLQALCQVPKSFGTLRRPAILFHRITEVDALALEPGVQKIGPRDNGGDDEQFGAEGQTGAVERMCHIPQAGMVVS